MIATNDQPEQSLTHTPSIAALAAALAKAQGAMKPAAKTAENPFFKSQYADLPACWESAREALASNGLAVIQMPETDGDRDYLTTTLCHSSGEWIRGRWKITATKSDPQSLGSALTYFRRYALCAVVGITAENEDDDGNAASAAAKVKQQQRAARPAQTQPTGASPAMAPERDYLSEYKRLLKDVGCTTAEDGTYVIDLVTNGTHKAVDGNKLIARVVVKALEDAAVFGAAKLGLAKHKAPVDSDMAMAGSDGP